MDADTGLGMTEMRAGRGPAYRILKLTNLSVCDSAQIVQEK